MSGPRAGRALDIGRQDQDMLDHWRLKDFDIGGGLAQGAERGAGAGWIPVEAPGDTYLALIAAGRLAHPFEGRNETPAAWVRDREWWWTTTFEALPASPGEQVCLIFEGLDTFATVYLDGEVLGQTDNMFRSFAFDIGERLTASGPHTLAIRFDPPAAVMAGRDTPAWPAFTDRVTQSRRNLMRKAQFGWGWDWGPDLPTVGVWKPVRLDRRTGPVIAGLNFATLTVSPERAEARVSVSLDAAAGRGDLHVTVTLTDPAGVQVAAATAPIAADATVDLTIPSPKLWWTADLGDQPLYTLAVQLRQGEAVFDHRSRRVGLRTIAIDTSPDPDEPGADFFTFVVNGAPIFAKGVCWVPASSFVGVTDEAQYRDLLTRAAGANMNMIRIWGGGVYEPDLFYDLCDELGLLVWQDFMFACANYPEDDPAFVDNVRQEVTEQVRRLRGRPCMAVWCGNNENQAMHDFNNRLAGTDTPLQGLLYYDKLIPEILADLDPTTPYRTSSPFGGPSPNSMRAGDVHNWTVWHGIPLIPDKDLLGDYDRSPAGVAYTRYAEDNCRFVSEFGIQAAPAMQTLRRWMAPEDLALGSEGLLERVKDIADKASAMMAPVTGLPRTLDDFIDFTQWTQAEGMKFGIEHFRRRAPHCSGALIWQYNDCWPCVSWSLIDYDGVAKASLHAVTRAFAPVLASFKPLEDDSFELWITNDTREPVSGQAVVELKRLEGGSDWREDVDYQIAAHASAPVWRGKAAASTGRLLRVQSADGAFAANRYLLAPIATLALKPGAQPAVTVSQVDADTLHVALAADTYLAFVHLTTDRADLRFSDNYFDMVAGETRSVTVRGAGGVEPAEIKVDCWNAR